MLPPPRASIKGIAARLTRTAERKLKLMMSFHSASSISTKGVHFEPPTLFTRISSPPKRLFAASTTAIAPSGVVTSCAMASTFAPRPSKSAAASASASAPRAQMQSRAPSAAKAAAMRLPMPRLAPVTKAILSLSPRSKLHSFIPCPEPAHRGWSRKARSNKQCTTPTIPGPSSDLIHSLSASTRASSARSPASTET